MHKTEGGHVRRRARFKPLRSRGEGAAFALLDINNWTVASEFQVHANRHLTLHFDFFANEVKWLPRILVLVFVHIGGVQFIHVQILLINVKLSPAKWNPIVVTAG